jgi:hypothetical protein
LYRKKLFLLGFVPQPNLRTTDSGVEVARPSWSGIGSDKVDGKEEPEPEALATLKKGGILCEELKGVPPEAPLRARLVEERDQP